MQTHNNTQASTKPNMNNPDEKITADLTTLSEQISLCQSMLVNAGPLRYPPYKIMKHY